MGHWKTVKQNGQKVPIPPTRSRIPFQWSYWFDTVAASPITVRRWNFRVKHVRTAVGETHAHTNEYGGGRILRRLSAKRYQTVEHTWAACVRRTCFRCISALNAATATKIAHADHYHCVYAHTDRAPRFRPVVRGTPPGGLHRNYCTAETCAALFSKVRNIYLFSCFQFSPVIVKHRIYTCQFVSVRSSFSLRSSRREGQARIQKRRESMNSPLHFINFLPKKTRLYSNVLRHFKSDKT